MRAMVGPRSLSLAAMAVFCLVETAAPNVVSAEPPSVPVFEAESAPASLPAEAKPSKDLALTLTKKPTDGRSIAKLTEAITLLDDLIRQSSPNTDNRAELLFQKGELLLQKARALEMMSFNTGTNDARMRQLLGESREVRRQAADAWQAVLKGHPNYTQRDDAAMRLGTNALSLDDPDAAIAAFTLLLKDHPQSKHLPLTTVQLGELFFEKGELSRAKAAYGAAMKIAPAKLALYARYKLGWVLINLDQNNAALVELTAVGSDRSADKGLRRDAIKGAVMAFAETKRPAASGLRHFDKALGHKDDVSEAVSLLAERYAETGRAKAAVEVYRQLIARHKTEFRVVGFQLEIVRNTDALSDPKGTARELLRAAKLLDAAKGWTADPDERAEMARRIERMIRVKATQWHRTGRTTGNQDFLALAQVLYQTHGEHFAASTHATDLRFFHGELLRELGDKSGALERYREVLAIKGDHAWTRDALWNALAILQKRPEPAPRTQAGAPRPLTQDDETIVAFADRFAALAPEDPNLPDILYLAARRLYLQDHLKDAAPRLAALARNHPDHPVAEVSARLHIDCLVLQGDNAQVEASARAYRTHPVLGPKLAPTMAPIEAKAAFSQCRAAHDSASWSIAADCYLSFEGRFPASDLADKALFNAAINQAALLRITDAIDTRRKILDEHPGSSLVSETVWLLATDHRTIAMYTPASHYFEAFAQFEPQDPRAREALLTAATYRRGLEQPKEAVANYERLLDTACKTPSSDCAEATFQIATVWDKAGLSKAAQRSYARFLALSGAVQTADRRLEALVRTAVLTDDPRAKAKRHKAVLKAYDALPSAQRKTLTTGADAAAQAQFSLAAMRTAEARAIELALPTSALQKSLGAKMAGYQKAQAMYRDVLGFGSTQWSLAAMFEMGAMLETFTQEVQYAPIPAMSTAQMDRYVQDRDLLLDQIEAQAVDAYKACLLVSRDQAWFNDHTHRASAALARIAPDSRPGSELFYAVPVPQGPTFESAPFSLRPIR